jgi:FAD synthetase
MGYGDEQMTEIEGRALRYILKTEKALRNLRIAHRSAVIEETSIIRIVDEAKRYFEDAKYYLGRKEYEVSLASISYCEGLLDALRMLELVEFEW